MRPPDHSTIHALRSDFALQIARHLAREGRSQAAAAARLGIPQPTLSRIVRGQVEAISLELMLKIAMRAGLPVVLQTGSDPAEAGVYVAGGISPGSTRPASRIAAQARRATGESLRALTPAQRLAAHLEHNKLVTALHRAGARTSGRRSRSSP
jgi:predicted XRE-type DNA-binding protein